MKDYNLSMRWFNEGKEQLMSRRCPKNRHLFLNWLKANRHRFSILPRVVKYHKHGIELDFVGITSAMKVFLHPRTGITVSVCWKGICWDLIGDFDVAERSSKAGYYCALCEPEYLVLYPTREELWIKHGFDTFLNWCNTTLVHANWLELADFDGVTSAMLHSEKPEDDKHWEPLIELVNGLIPLGGTKADVERTCEIKSFIIPVAKYPYSP